MSALSILAKSAAPQRRMPYRSSSSSLGLQKRSFPRCRKVMRSAIRSRSVVMCEDIRIECSSSCTKSQNTSSISSRMTGSRPLVASSRIRSLGRWERAAAISSFMRIPLESALISLRGGRAKRAR